jgi:hypothetical protein
MEVAKLILNVVKQKAHMTISVKPFGCMPSSGVSDGVQSVITEILPEAIFCPVETSGDGAVNFYSRVQMFLFKARQRALEEYQQTLEEYGVTQEQLEAFIAEHPKYGTPFYQAPHITAGTAADIVHEIAPLVGKSRLGRARIHAARRVKRTQKWFGKDGKFWVKKAREMAPYLPALARFAAVEAADALPNPQNVWSDVMEKLTGQTDEEKELVRKAEADLAMLDEVGASPAQSGERQLRVMA